MTDEQALERLGIAEVLALTAIGEQRGDSREGGSSLEERLGCMMTIRNRTAIPKRFGATYNEVCLKRKQYSCWNEGDPNRAYLMPFVHVLAEGDGVPISGSMLEETLYLARGITLGVIRDATNGATHYYSPRSMVPANSVPYWAHGKEPCARIGSSLYFKGV
jgi:N-acetylmuramoyl-L-alanine amidase